MAHVAKYTRSAMGHLLSHYDRSKDNLGSNIDWDRTNLNYNLAPNREITQTQFIQQRCEEVKALKRQNINVMCDWVITAPKDLPKASYQDFFQESYNFMAERYGGEKNVVSAYVHMDETQPHMHFSFVPIKNDLEKGKERLSAKEVIDRTELQMFHKDLSNHLELSLGARVNVLNGATVDGNKSIEELKRNTAQAKQELKEIQKEVIAWQKEKPKRPKKVELKEPNKSIFGKETIPYADYKQQIADYEKLLKSYSKSIDSLNSYKAENNTLKNDLKGLNKRLNELDNTNPFTMNKALKLENKLISKDIQKTLTENKSLKSENSKLKSKLELHQNFYDELTKKLSKLEKSQLDIVKDIVIPENFVTGIMKSIGNLLQRDKQRDSGLELGIER